MTRPSFVVVTAGDANGRRLTHVLARLGIPFKLLTIAHAPPRRGKRTLVQHLRAQLRARLAAHPLLRAARHATRPRFAVSPHYLGFCNGPRMKAELQRLAPDYILMMGGGIIDVDVISTARQGVLNVHPGLLPWIRGVDVIRHAVARGVPIGVTAHFIDPGIDTGDVIEQVRLSIETGDDHAAIEAKADSVSVAFMASLAHRLWQGEALPRRSQIERFPLCRLMSAEDASLIDARIRNGAALELAATSTVANEISSDAALCAFYDECWPPAERF